MFIQFIVSVMKYKKLNSYSINNFFLLLFKILGNCKRTFLDLHLLVLDPNYFVRGLAAL